MTRALLPALVLSLALGAVARAAEISVRARLDRPQARVGEAVDLAVETTGAQDVPAPAIAGADGLQVRYAGPATQLSITNNQVSASVTHHFSVTATKPGTYAIGPIAVEYGGKRYDAGTVRLEAVAAAAAGSGGERAAPGGEPLRLVLSAPRASVYLHERVPLRLALYVGNVRVTDVRYPTIPGDGFALEPLGEPAQRREQTAQGAFQVLDFATTVTPLRSGTLTVGPAELELSVLNARRGGDPFFERFFGDDPFASSRRPLALHSEPLALEVLPLPEAGRPADFSGAVGRFELDASVAPRELQAGDPVTITMTVRGEGNLESLTPPAVQASDALRVYPVQATSPSPAAARSAPATQSKTFEQVVIPQQAGTVTLPELRFSYFDPGAREYRTASRPAVTLAVAAAARAAAEPPVTGAPAAPVTPPEALGRDIVFVKDTPGALARRGAHRYRSVAFWAYQALPLAAWAAVVLYDRRRRRHDDPRYARFTRAGREARRAITAARERLRAGDAPAFYDTVSGAMRDYLAAKFELPPGSVTAETVGDRLRGRGVPAEITGELAELFAACERARFAPTARSDGDMGQTLARAESVLRALERARRAAPPIAATALLAWAAWHGAGLADRACVLCPAAAAADGAPAPAGVEQPNTVFFHAGDLYTQERYTEAAAEYERLLAAGYESGNLYFNLGNAYFKAGDLGRAVLNYERARRLTPRDPDVRANLEYARARTGAGDDDEPVYARLLFPLAAVANGDDLLLAASLLYTALMLALVLARLLPGARRTGSAAALAAGAALVIVLASAGHRLLAVELPTRAVVVGKQEAPVRFEPATGGTAHFQAKPGTLLRVLARRQGWAQVARADGERGWIALDAIAAL